MVTGDDVTTGAAIAKQVGIGGEAILGADFAALSESERLARIDGIGVVGRVAPEHKPAHRCAGRCARAGRTHPRVGEDSAGHRRQG
jgi:hypothetical protein